LGTSYNDPVKRKVNVKKHGAKSEEQGAKSKEKGKRNEERGERFEEKGLSRLPTRLFLCRKV